MKTISMLEFRRTAESVLKKVQQGQRFVLTYRGQPVARLEPVEARSIPADDPFYALGSLASGTAAALSNEEMDRIIYET